MYKRANLNRLTAFATKNRALSEVLPISGVLAVESLERMTNGLPMTLFNGDFISFLLFRKWSLLDSLLPVSVVETPNLAWDLTLVVSLRTFVK